MKFYMTLVLGLTMVFFSSAQEKWTFEQGLNTAKMYCHSSEAMRVGEQHADEWRSKGQIDYAKGIMDGIARCKSGESPIKKKGAREGCRKPAVCSKIDKKNNAALYAALCSCPTDDKDKGEQ
ncbi:hypothetical protein [Flagellimonas algicola]|uniref:Uncharacterized protein n=1 Tax=Flagellimonas algicola TaxID=2583815 RepID=A0ABY2WJ47_9FLAO|nr:hypothetical protein [Allomuricauda algicola]TMU54867.1 hypothetical protein FGG15_11765 [Allomuricauda algicola]